MGYFSTNTRIKGINMSKKSQRKPFENLVGKTFGNLIVLEYIGEDGRKRLWKCVCGCEAKPELIVAQNCLKDGRTVSCGCIISPKNRTHGLTGTKEYKAWDAMRSRCNNQNDISYKDYGGRGIKVCERWDSSFENFLADIGFAPTKNHSIDRIDVNGNYEPENLRWATRKEQENNKRKTIYITYDNQSLTISSWSDKIGIDYIVLWNRYKDGWSPEEILTRPVSYSHRKSTYKQVTINGETHTIQEWADIVGVSYHTMKRRINTTDDPVKLLAKLNEFNIMR
jgi:hypothetical protein